MDQVDIVYAFRDARRRVIYVGVTDNLNRRLAQHVADKPWQREIKHVDVLKAIWGDRDLAEQFEASAIHELRPLRNKAHRLIAVRGCHWCSAGHLTRWAQDFDDDGEEYSPDDRYTPWGLPDRGFVSHGRTVMPR